MSEGEASETKVPAPAPAKKRKKKRKGGEASGLEGPPLPEGFPAFAKAFPDHPRLNELVRAFERGNYARVREGGRRLLEETKEADTKGADKGGAAPYRETESEAEDLKAVRRATRELLRRIEPDPIAVYMLVGSILLLAFLAIWYWSNPHAAH
jgi:hypothetical protein